MDYLCNCKSEISNVCNALEGHCLEAMKVMHHHANGRFDWLISEHQSVNPSREAISILSEKYKRFTFVHPVCLKTILFFIFINLLIRMRTTRSQTLSLIIKRTKIKLFSS